MSVTQAERTRPSLTDVEANQIAAELLRIAEQVKSQKPIVDDAPAATIDYILAQIISADLTIRESSKVFEFLLHNPPELIEAIEAVRKRVRDVFPDESLYLEMYFDKEDQQGDHLIITIATPLNAEEAGMRWEELVEDDGLDDLDEMRPKLAFTFEFK